MPLFAHLYYQLTSVHTEGAWLRYPCHVTPKDSQRSGSEGTEGPQMELHQLVLLCPSAVTSPRPSHHLTPWGARPAPSHAHKDTQKLTCTAGYALPQVVKGTQTHAEWINEVESVRLRGV